MTKLALLVYTDGRDQKAIAAKAGISAGYLSELVKGKYGTDLNPELLRRLAEALGVDPSVLTDEVSRDQIIGLSPHESACDDSEASQPPTSGEVIAPQKKHRPKK